MIKRILITLVILILPVLVSESIIKHYPNQPLWFYGEIRVIINMLFTVIIVGYWSKFFHKK